MKILATMGKIIIVRLILYHYHKKVGLKYSMPILKILILIILTLTILNFNTSLIILLSIKLLIILGLFLSTELNNSRFYIPLSISLIL
jgi:hypothetical protein